MVVWSGNHGLGWVQGCGQAACSLLVSQSSSTSLWNFSLFLLPLAHPLDICSPNSRRNLSEWLEWLPLPLLGRAWPQELLISLLMGPPWISACRSHPESGHLDIPPPAALSQELWQPKRKFPCLLCTWGGAGLNGYLLADARNQIVRPWVWWSCSCFESKIGKTKSHWMADLFWRAY